MTRCAEPGEPGFSEGVAAGFLLRVALGLLDNVGPGLDLVNALRDRFPGATMEQAGRWATWASGARSAGDAILTADPGSLIDLDDIPMIPGSGLWADNPMDRIRVDAVVTSTGPGGEPRFVTVTVFGESVPTAGSLLEDIFEAAGEALNVYASTVGGSVGTPSISSVSILTQY